jgi:hypothetical protein
LDCLFAKPLGCFESICDMLHDLFFFF